MARVEPVTPSGQHRRETERDSYGGERRWAVGAGASWTETPASRSMHPGDRQTDPESARWRGPDAEPERSGGVLRKLSDELGITTPGPKNYRRSDERIREDVCERLWDEPQIDVGDVSVEVREGVVTLEGTVPDRRMKRAIEDVAAGCRGVSDVENRIRIPRG